MPQDRAGLLPSIGFGTLCLASAFSTWNAVRVAGVSPADFLFALAAACLLLGQVLHGRLPRLPASMVGGAALIALSGLLALVDPPSASFLGTRFVGQADALDALRVEEASRGIVVLAKALFAMLVVPLACVAVGAPHRLRAVLMWWALGSAVSCLVAVLDTIGLTGINLALVQQVDLTGRASGLSSQPNHLAVGAVLALPVLLLGARQASGVWRVVAAAASAVTLAGIYVSGSRGGAVAAALVLGALVIMLLRSQPHAVLAVVGASLVAVALAAEQLVQILERLRLVGGGGALSDGVRADLRDQALRDVAHSPFYGIGFEQINAAHEVHLQLLASGGILALTGYLLYVYGVLARARRAVARDRWAGRAAVVAIGAWLLLGLVESQVIDRYLYVPVGVVVALAGRATATTPAGVRRETSPQGASR